MYCIYEPQQTANVAAQRFGARLRPYLQASPPRRCQTEVMLAQQPQPHATNGQRQRSGSSTAAALTRDRRSPRNRMNRHAPRPYYAA